MFLCIFGKNVLSFCAASLKSQWARRAASPSLYIFASPPASLLQYLRTTYLIILLFPFSNINFICYRLDRWNVWIPRLGKNSTLSKKNLKNKLKNLTLSSGSILILSQCCCDLYKAPWLICQKRTDSSLKGLNSTLL